MIGGSNIIAFFIRDPEECQNVVPNPFCSPACVQDTTICVGHPGSQLLQNIRKLSEAVSSRSHADPRTHRGTRDRAYWPHLSSIASFSEMKHSLLLPAGLESGAGRRGAGRTRKAKLRKGTLSISIWLACFSTKRNCQGWLQLEAHELPGSRRADHASSRLRAACILG